MRNNINELKLTELQQILDDSITEFLNAIASKDICYVKKLYEADNNVINDIWKKKGYNPLIMAAMLKKIDIALWLINETPINLNYTSKCGWTAFMWACYNKSYEVCNRLIDKGANIFYVIGNVSAFDNLDIKSQEAINIIQRAFEPVSNVKNSDFVSNKLYNYCESDITICKSSKKTGMYGKVFKSFDNITKRDVVIKLYNDQADQIPFENTIKEFFIINLINKHYNNVTAIFLGSYSDSDNIISMVMEPLKCDLRFAFEIYLKLPNNVRLTFYKKIFKEIVECIKKIHSLGITHNDIKSNNIMLADDNLIRIIDFSIADFCCFGQLNKIAHNYIAPEYVKAPDGTNDVEVELDGSMIKIQVDRKSFHSDIFSIGRVFLEGILKKATYDDNILVHNDIFFIMRSKTKEKVAYLEKVSDDWINEIKSFSSEFYELVKQMMSSKGSQRPSAEQILQHPFFFEYDKQSNPGLESNSGSQKSLKRDRNTISSIMFITPETKTKMQKKLQQNYLRYSRTVISNESFEIQYMESIHNSYKYDRFDKFVLMNSEKVNVKMYHILMNWILDVANQKNLYSVDVICNCAIKIYNVVAPQMCKSKKTFQGYGIMWFYLAGTIFTYDAMELDYMIYICGKAYTESEFTNFFKVAKEHYPIENFYNYCPVMVHVQYITVILQINKVYPTEILQIQSYLSQGLINYCMHRYKFSFNSLVLYATTWDITQAIYYSYFLKMKKNVVHIFDLNFDTNFTRDMSEFLSEFD
jgi:serine/threonine protein kinase